MSDTTATVPPLFAAAGDPVQRVRPVEWSAKAKPLGGLHAWLRGALIAYVITDLVSAVHNSALLWIYASLERGVEFSELQLNTFDFLAGYASLVSSWLFIASYVLAALMFCRFSFRAIRNLDYANARGERMPASWAVAYNFIPLMNIWKPLQAMRQAWRGSLDPDLNRVDPPASMGGWWVCWLISNVVANVSFQISLRSGAFSGEISNFESFKFSLWLDVASSIISTASVFFLLAAIKPIVTAQDGRTSAPRFTPPTPPPAP
jgi:hypothetical protein